MHFHGVRYRFGSDGSYIPGFSGQARTSSPARRSPTGSRQGRARAACGRYHDHSPSMMESIAGGMYGALSVLGRRAAARPGVRRLPRAHLGLTTDQRARLRRQHAGVPGQGRRRRPVGRARDRQRLPHLPRPRPPLGPARRDAAGHAGHRARGELPRPLARGHSRHVAVPLPRRGAHDERDDRSPSTGSGSTSSAARSTGRCAARSTSSGSCSRGPEAPVTVGRRIVFAGLAPAGTAAVTLRGPRTEQTVEPRADGSFALRFALTVAGELPGGCRGALQPGRTRPAQADRARGPERAPASRLGVTGPTRRAGRPAALRPRAIRLAGPDAAARSTGDRKRCSGYRSASSGSGRSCGGRRGGRTRRLRGSRRPRRVGGVVRSGGGHSRGHIG